MPLRWQLEVPLQPAADDDDELISELQQKHASSLP